MKIHLLLILILFSLGVYSQEKTPVNKPDKVSIELLFQLNYGSTNLTNEFMDKLMFGGKIDTDLKNKILENTNNINRFGFELNYEAKVYILDTIFPKYPDYTYYFGFGSFRDVNAKYSSDFFETLFYGNKRFSDKTAELGNTHLIDSKFEKITFGILHKNRNSSLGISLIIGDKYNSYDFKKADLYTQPDGRELTLDYDGKILQSDSLNNGFMAFSGAGFALDFRHVFSIYKQQISLNIANFGIGIWKRNSKYSNVQKNYIYNGLEVDNLINVGSGEIDSIAKELLPETQKKGFTTLLPASIRLDKTFEFNKKLQPIYGMRYKLVSNYIPSAYIGAHYNVNKHIGFSSALAFGGYTNVRITTGAYFNYKKIFTGIETSNLIGLFNKNSHGKGAGIYLFTQF